jgi:hypothetical protein
MERSPHQLAEDRLQLAADYSAASEALERILSVKPATWQNLRESTKSDKAADKLWEATALGIEEMQLRMKCKRIEKQMSAIKTMVDIYQGEARNNY